MLTDKWIVLVNYVASKCVNAQATLLICGPLRIATNSPPSVYCTFNVPQTTIFLDLFSLRRKCFSRRPSPARCSISNKSETLLESRPYDEM